MDFFRPDSCSRGGAALVRSRLPFLCGFWRIRLAETRTESRSGRESSRMRFSLATAAPPRRREWMSDRTVPVASGVIRKLSESLFRIRCRVRLARLSCSLSVSAMIRERIPATRFSRLFPHGAVSSEGKKTTRQPEPNNPGIAWMSMLRDVARSIQISPFPRRWGARGRIRHLGMIGDRIVARAAPWTASSDTANREQAAAQGAVLLERFESVDRAGRLVAAEMPDPWRKNQPVGAYG